MKGDLREYCRIGLVHHMIYPRSLMDPDYHVRTLEALARRADIDTLDCCMPYGKARQARLVEALRACGKSEITYALHLFPARKLWPSTQIPHEQHQVRMIIGDMVEQAAAMGATAMVFASGGPAYRDATSGDIAGFADFCRWLAEALRQHGMTLLIEPTDFDIDKRFLYGPTRACAELIQSLKPDVSNFAILADMAHAPLLGETFSQALHESLPHLGRVHIGNCVLKDPQHPLYGDRHPPIGTPGGEVDTQQIVDVLRCLLDIGYLSKERRGTVLLEMLPWPDLSPEETISEQLGRVYEAWERA